MKKQIGLLVLVVGLSVSSVFAVETLNDYPRNRRHPAQWIKNPERHYESMLRQWKRNNDRARRSGSYRQASGWWNGTPSRPSCVSYW